MKNRPIVLFFAGCLSGMAAVWNDNVPAAVFYCPAVLGFWIFWIRSHRRYLIGLGGMLLGIVLLFAQRQTADREIQFVEQKKPETVSGEVLQISETEKSMAYRIRQPGLDGDVMLYDTSGVRIKAGDQITAEAEIKVQEEAANPGQFSAKNYYFARGIYYRAFAREIKVTGHRKRKFLEMLETSRLWVGKQIRRQYEGEAADFIQGMLLGDKSGLDEERKDDFRESGLIHLLAVSGLHISLAGRSLYRFLRRIGIGFCISSLLGFAAAVYYGMLTGASVSSVRAVLMLGIYFISQILGKSYDLLSSAAMAGTGILLSQPFYFGDTGFLLSFCAVIIIGCIGQKRGKKGSIGKKIWEKIWFPLKLQTGMLPLTIYIQYETPVFSFLANAAAVPLASAGFFAALVSIWLPPFVLHKVIGGIFWLVLRISELEYGMITVGEVPLWWIAAGYAVLYLFMKQQVKLPLHVRMGMIYAGLLCMAAVPLLRQKNLAFLDVGQGDCMMADTAAGIIAVDGGSSSVKKTGRYRMLPYLRSRGKQKITMAVISHMDEDHVSGILELLEMGRIRYLGLPDISEDKAYQEMRQTAEQAGTEIFLLSKGKTIRGADFCLEVLHPPAGSSLEKNAASLVLQGEINGKQILLTGDVEKEGEEELLTAGLHPVDILKAAHHGSKNSTLETFLDLVRPETTVISCGEDNRYGHPHKEVLERLSEYGTRIYRTDRDGAVIFR